MNLENSNPEFEIQNNIDISMNPDIKIFVSHRIDVNSVLVNNSIYVPVKCGAVFSETNNHLYLGDDTGDNISEKRMMYGELTVQYWAWKNCTADYYGLCHYRRYLSFSDNTLANDHFNMCHEIAITDKAIKKHNLFDEIGNSKVIIANDVVFLRGASVKIILVKGGYPKTVRELWEAHHNLFIDKKYIDILLSVIKEYRPGYYKSAVGYFNSDIHYGFNCFVMKKEFFLRLCEFQFPVLFKLENQIKNEHYTGLMERLPGYLGEIMYGIFIYHLINVEHVKYKELPAVFFSTTERVNGTVDYLYRWLRENVKSYIGEISLRILPRGTKRRQFIKQLFK